MGDSLIVAGIVGVPVFFLLLINIGPAQQQFSSVYGMLDQVATYQFIGAAPPCFDIFASLAPADSFYHVRLLHGPILWNDSDRTSI